MFDLEIKNATIVTSTESFRGTMLIKDGKIAAISEKPLNNAKKTIDADGLHLVPGMVDQHVHFMDPGDTDREDFIHGSSAAAIGGVTTVIEHTHSSPVRSVEAYKNKVEHISSRSLVDYGFTAHVFPEDIGNLRELWDNGIIQFKIFTCTTHGIPTLNNDELFHAFKEIASFDGRCLVHCEDDAITEGNEKRLKKLKRSDNGIITEWRSDMAEEIAVSNVALMTRLTGLTTTIAHTSHPFIIDLIKREQKEGAKLFAEVCPQYLFLSDEDVKERGSFAKFTPPARSKEHTTRMLDLINDGSIQILSTDHAPSTVEQKCKGSIWECNFGLPGVETTLPMMLNLVSEGKITLQRVVQMYSEMPSRTLGLYPKKGCINVGADADIVLLDLSYKWTIKNEDIVSKSGWSPFNETDITGKPVVTIVRGNIIAKDGKIIEKPGVGNIVSRVNENKLDIKQSLIKS